MSSMMPPQGPPPGMGPPQGGMPPQIQQLMQAAQAGDPQAIAQLQAMQGGGQGGPPQGGPPPGGPPPQGGGAPVSPDVQARRAQQLIQMLRARGG